MSEQGITFSANAECDIKPFEWELNLSAFALVQVKVNEFIAHCECGHIYPVVINKISPCPKCGERTALCQPDLPFKMLKK